MPTESATTWPSVRPSSLLPCLLYTSRQDLERMIAGPDRGRVRTWLASLPPAIRTIFVLRAVAGFTAPETASLLVAHAGSAAAGWTLEDVRELFRQGLCSLASQVLHAAHRLSLIHI